MMNMAMNLVLFEVRFDDEHGHELGLVRGTVDDEHGHELGLVRGTF